MKHISCTCYPMWSCHGPSQTEQKKCSGPDQVFMCRVAVATTWRAGGLPRGGRWRVACNTRQRTARATVELEPYVYRRYNSTDHDCITTAHGGSLRFFNKGPSVSPPPSVHTSAAWWLCSYLSLACIVSVLCAFVDVGLRCISLSIKDKYSLPYVAPASLLLLMLV